MSLTPASSSTTGTTTPSEHTHPSNSSGYLSYPVSHVVSGLYRRLTDSSPNRLAPKLTTNGSSQSIRDSSNTSNGVYTPPHRNQSPFQPPPLTPLSLDHIQDLNEPILSKAIAEEIRLLVPPRLQLAERWSLIYSLERDGATISTLYNKCLNHETDGPVVLVIQDGLGGIFGAYLTEPPRPQPHFYGTGECFLWRASLLPSGSNQLLRSLLPPPPSAPEAETEGIGRSTTIASPTSPRQAAGGMASFDLLTPEAGDASGHDRSSSDGYGIGDTDPNGTHTRSNGHTRAADADTHRHSQQHADTSFPINPHPSKPSKTETSPQASSIPSPSRTSATETPSPHLLRFKAFPYSGVNDYLIFCEPSFLSVGGGDGRYGLWLNSVLERGISGQCMTFGNEALSEEGEKFEIVGVEVWGISTASSS